MDCFIAEKFRKIWGKRKYPIFLKKQKNTKSVGGVKPLRQGKWLTVVPTYPIKVDTGWQSLSIANTYYRIVLPQQGSGVVHNFNPSTHEAAEG